MNTDKQQYFFEIISKENGRKVYGIFKDAGSVGIATAFVESEAEMIIDALNAQGKADSLASVADALAELYALAYQWFLALGYKG